MAEYADEARCVRAAAGGFSPEAAARMPGRKTRRRGLFHRMLESGAPKPEQGKAMRGKIVPAVNCGRGSKDAQLCKKERNSGRKRKKERDLACENFCDCICGKDGVLC
ncbi:MAG: hypothetical protein IJB18_10590 [Clostridia bacterium]|nr:hypothetical protein [Clostridia bacterium]